MSESIITPILNDALSFLNKINFGIVYVSAFRHYEDPKADPLHIHKSLEIFINVSSDVSFIVNNQHYSVLNGDAIVSLPNDIHVCLFNKSAIHNYFCLWIDADLNLPMFSFLKEKKDALYSFDDASKKQLRSLAFSLLNVYERENSDIEKYSYLFQILTIFKQSQKAVEKNIILPVTFQKILDNININFATIHSVDDILNKYFVSSSTLTRWFRKYIHTTPREYLESVRLSNAATMLLNGSSVTDACINSGFKDCSRFILLFKKKFSKTPLQYKKEHHL